MLKAVSEQFLRCQEAIAGVSIDRAPCLHPCPQHPCRPHPSRHRLDAVAGGAVPGPVASHRALADLGRHGARGPPVRHPHAPGVARCRRRASPHRGRPRPCPRVPPAPHGGRCVWLPVPHGRGPPGHGAALGAHPTAPPRRRVPGPDALRGPPRPRVPLRPPRPRPRHVPRPAPLRALARHPPRLAPAPGGPGTVARHVSRRRHRAAGHHAPPGVLAGPWRGGASAAGFQPHSGGPVVARVLPFGGPGCGVPSPRPPPSHGVLAAQGASR